MKSLLILLATFIFIVGCEKEFEVDTTPPPSPQGIKTISLDNAVEIQWLPSQADDLEGYNIWVSATYEGRYQLISTVETTHFVYLGAINGNTYYYAVSAFDYHKNESELSKEVIFDTPRPEGYGVIIADTSSLRSSSGYGFGVYSVLDCYNLNTDIFFTNNGTPHIRVWSDTDIQDMGYTSSLDEISSSPQQGWSPSKSAEAIVGHTYVIWTVDNHYAKVRVLEVTTHYILFDWAYQTAVSNPELKLGIKSRTGKRLPERLHINSSR